MAEQSEAACLLETGALYRKRIGLVTMANPGDLTFAGFKHGAFSLYFGDEPIFHFDRDGRWQRAFIENLHFLKGLDGSVHRIERRRDGGNMILRRTRLAPDEVDALDERIREVALNLREDLDEGLLRRLEPPMGKADPLEDSELRGILETISSWDCTAWRAQHERYLSTYGPLPFLPPECLGAVVLQATLGHAGGRAFGGSAASEFQARPVGDFARHAADVATLWGRRLLQTRQIFLAGGDVLRQPSGQVEAYLEAIGKVFPLGKNNDADAIQFDGVHAFLDDFSDLAPGRPNWRRFAELRLQRVSLGVESGDPLLRSLFGRRWSDDELRSVVAQVKAAGLGISVLTLVGGGGSEHADEHRDRTVDLIASLELERGDFVFLLDETEICDPDQDRAGFAFLPREEWEEQQGLFKEALAPLRKRGIKVLPYTLEKQWT